MAANLNARLKNHPFFKPFPDEALNVVAPLARRTSYEKGDLIIKTDRLADRFFLIEKGEVAVDMATSSGKDYRIDRLSDGDVLGWSWLIPPHEWKFDARALDNTDVIEFDGDHLRDVCNDFPALGNLFYKGLCEALARRLTMTRFRFLDESQTMDDPWER